MICNFMQNVAEHSCSSLICIRCVRLWTTCSNYCTGFVNVQLVTRRLELTYKTRLHNPAAVMVLRALLFVPLSRLTSHSYIPVLRVQRSCRVTQKVTTQVFVYHEPRIAYQRHKIVRKVVESFNQYVQCLSVMICNQKFQTKTALIVNSINKQS